MIRLLDESDKSALETKIEEVDSNMNNTRGYFLSDNIYEYNASDDLQGKFYDTNGALVSANHVNSTGLLDVSAYDCIDFYVKINQRHVLTFWDKDEKFIKGIESTNTVNKDINVQNAYYIRLAYYNDKAQYISAIGKSEQNNNSIVIKGLYGETIIKSLKTKSENIFKYNTFSILGDSYSTFKGYTTPENNVQWYPDNKEHINNDVNNVNETWWYLFANETNCVLDINNSYSGSTVCYDSYNSGIVDGKSSSFISRMNNVGKPQLLIIEGGTNDSWANAGMGEYIYSDWSEDDMSYYRPALAKLLDYTINHNIGSKIIFMLNNGLSTNIIESTKTICSYYNIPLLFLDNIDKIDRHPSKLGMKQIKNQLIDFLNEI